MAVLVQVSPRRAFDAVDRVCSEAFRAGRIAYDCVCNTEAAAVNESRFAHVHIAAARQAVEASRASGVAGLQLDDMHDRELKVAVSQIPVFIADRNEGRRASLCAIVPQIV